MTRTFLVAAATAAAFTTPALAQSNDSAGEFRAYAGALAGYDDIKLSVPGVGSGSEGDALFGAVVGGEYDFGPGSAGIEAEFSDSNVGVAATDVDVIGDKATLSAGRDVYIGARAGFNLSPRAVLYVKGGYTNLRFNASYDDGAGSTFKEHVNRDGLRVGGGAEFALTRNIRLRGEYRYSDYKSYDPGIGVNIDAKRNQFVTSIVGAF
jgi:outer membrane immunogenic protein